MEIRLLKKSEIHLLEAFFFKGWSMLPNYSILSQELKKYASQLRKQNYLDTKITKRKGKQIVGFFHQMQLVMIAHVEYSKQGMSIYSSILHENVKFTWSDYLEQFEKMARQLQCQTIQFQLLSELSPDLNERFFEAGYQKENYHFSKKLDIKKGIALGGGGARGSYAIGVWKYFDEQQIDFDIICGTSIGASIAGLMVSSTVEKAIQMWEEIDTSQILDFDGANTSDISLASLLLTIKEMAKSSLATTGISSAPLYSLIHKYYDLDKLHNTSKQL
ncbi:MAG: patatin-like phospholipase family protein, partial [Streptococcaceae bacterium]|nr:patatin-like phospholipase family protein [Streptococcaceae bacterium]